MAKLEGLLDGLFKVQFYTVRVVQPDLLATFKTANTIPSCRVDFSDSKSHVS